MRRRLLVLRTRHFAGDIDLAHITRILRSQRLTLACTILLAGSLAACASGPDKRPPRGGGGERPGAAAFQGQAMKPVALLFAAMDRDGDLIVDGQELIGGIDQEWQRFSDSGAARAIKFEDWALMTLGTRDALPSFAAFDRNLDGKISQQEFDDRIRGEFTELDKNGDGRLERSELVFRVSRPSRDEPSQGRGGGSGGGGGGGRPPRGR